MRFSFEHAFAKLDAHEGGYVNHPRDPGGATNRGVTQRTYDSWRRQNSKPPRSVREITDSEVLSIYRHQYWDSIRADHLPSGVNYCVFDAAVNSGVSRAVKWAQKTAGMPRHEQDGVVGVRTIDALSRVDAVEFIDAYCDRRLAFMQSLPHWPTFKRGWSARVADVRRVSKAWAQQKDEPVRPTLAPTPSAKPPSSLVGLLVMAIVGGAIWLWSKVRGK